VSHGFTFVAPAARGWGEAVLGLRIARALIERGHQVTFAAPRALGPLLASSGAKPVPLNAHRQRLSEVVPRLLSRSNSAALVLVDAATWSWRPRTDRAFLRRLDLPVVALDVWHIGERGFRWDFSDSVPVEPEPVPASLRLLPAPFLRPTLRTGTYDALPRLAPTSRTSRQNCRDRVGISGRERLILLTSAHWQSGAQTSIQASRLARLLPWLAAALVGRAGEGVRVLHVGPEPWSPFRTALGRRYRWTPQLAPPAFEQALRAADLLLGFNAAGTSAGAAIALGIPVLTGVNSYAFGSVDQALGVLGSDCSPFIHSWLRKAVPLYPFAMWPVGFHRVMRRVLARNPYRRLINPLEILEEDRFVARLRELLYDVGARRASYEAHASYRGQLTRLPHAADLITDFLA
jgi:Family of unknown function (DUF6365)